MFLPSIWKIPLRFLRDELEVELGAVGLVEEVQLVGVVDSSKRHLLFG